MKKLLMIMIVLGWFSPVFSQFSEVRLQASGLTCAMCSKAVKVALEKLEFVEKVMVSIKTQEYTLSFKNDADADFDALRHAVEDAGFSVASLKLKASVSSIKAVKDAHFSLAGKTFHILNGRNQVLNGEQTLLIVDKGFLSSKAFRKYSVATSLECFRTGKAASCCAKEGVAENARVYHVTI